MYRCVFNHNIWCDDAILFCHVFQLKSVIFAKLIGISIPVVQYELTSVSEQILTPPETLGCAHKQKSQCVLKRWIAQTVDKAVRCVYTLGKRVGLFLCLS